MASRILLVFVQILFSFSAFAASKEIKSCVKLFGIAAGGEMFQEDKNGNYAGLAPLGLEKIQEARSKLIEADALTRMNIFEREAAIQATRIAQTGGWDVLVLGLGGGAKTSMFEFMIPGLWQTHLHELMDLRPLVGGETLEGLNKGIIDHNFDKTLMTAEFGMLDELEKGPPPVLGGLLELLASRKLTIGGEDWWAENLRTIIAVGNATRPGINQYFKDAGRPFTAQPFLNRFQIKMRFPNDLRHENQMANDALTEKKLILHSLGNPKHADNAVFRNPQPIDFNTLMRFAYQVFRPTPEFKVVMLDFVKNLKDATHAAVRQSEINYKSDPKTYSHVLEPSADFTERLRAQFIKIVLVSAALDFLRSPLSEGAKLEKETKEPIMLGPNSLWRLWPILTTVDQDRVVFDPYSGVVYFGARTNSRGEVIPQDVRDRVTNARTVALQQEHTELADEQDRFNEHLLNAWKVLKTTQEDAARVGGKRPSGEELFGKSDFEIRLATAGGTDVMRVKLGPSK